MEEKKNASHLGCGARVAVRAGAAATRIFSENRCQSRVYLEPRPEPRSGYFLVAGVVTRAVRNIPGGMDLWRYQKL